MAARITVVVTPEMTRLRDAVNYALAAFTALGAVIVWDDEEAAWQQALNEGWPSGGDD